MAAHSSVADNGGLAQVVGHSTKLEEVSAAFARANEERKYYETAVCQGGPQRNHYELHQEKNYAKRVIWPPLSAEVNAPGQISLDMFKASRGDKDIFNHLETTNLQPTSTSSSALASKSLPNHVELGQLYNPLHHGRNIRVFEIFAGELNQPLAGQFHYCNLDMPHLEFEALSYVWGQSVTTKAENTTKKNKPMITCNRHGLRVTVNLMQALQHIRSKSDTVFLWVDAICINQRDQEERRNQVSLMGHVYKKAKRVIAWLGEGSKLVSSVESQSTEDTNARKAFSAICSVVNHWGRQRSDEPMARFQFHDEIWQERSLDGSSLSESEGMSSTPQIGSGALPTKQHDEVLDLQTNSDQRMNISPLQVPIGYLFDQPWFTRVWVIQEVVLAQNTIVKWGHAEISWHWIGLAAAIIRTNYPELCYQYEFGWCGIYNAYLMFRISNMSDLPPLKLSFLQLLRLTRQFYVSDPRDKVYGLLGIHTTDNDPQEGQLFVDPDYSISAAELCIRVARKVISETQNLSILSSSQWHVLDRDDPLQTTVPSWVPEWNSVIRPTLSPWGSEDRFSAGKSFPLRLETTPNNYSLVVEGTGVGVVVQIFAIEIGSMILRFSPTMNLKAFLETERGLRLLSRTLTAGRNWYGTLLQGSNNCLADFSAYLLKSVNSFNGVHGLPNLEKPFSSQAASVLERLAANGDMSSFQAAARPVCQRRSIFLTDDGFLGLAPDTIEDGDILCVLSGGDVPFLLRPIRPKSNFRMEEAQPTNLCTSDLSIMKYYLVGECYVEGLMQGEAIEALHKGSAIRGPVEPSLVVEDIMSKVDELKGRKRKYGKFIAELQLTVDMFESTTEIALRKSWFDIC